MTSRTLKITLSLAGLFLLGAVCGTALSVTTPVRQAARSFIKSATAEQRVQDETVWFEKLAKEDESELKLTSEQRSKLRPQLDSTRQRLKQLREETGLQVRQIMKEHREAMLPILSKEQRDAFRKLDHVRKERANRVKPAPAKQNPPPKSANKPGAQPKKRPPQSADQSLPAEAAQTAPMAPVAKPLPPPAPAPAVPSGPLNDGTTQPK